MQIPDDITPILREIDQSLKEKAIPPHSRPIMAVIEFGNRFRISLPIAKLPPGAPEELVATSVYTDRIHRWYEEVYGDLIKTDFSEKAKVAVLADGDIWEMRIPLIYGMAVIGVKRELPKEAGNRIGTKVLDINACASLTGITEARLQHFSDDDLNEVYGLFVVGLDVRNEPPRVYRRVIYSFFRRPYRVCSGFDRTPPLLLLAGRSRLDRAAGGCYTSRPISGFPIRLRASISMGRSG